MHLSKTVGSALLIAGTCVGAATLALPVVTASSGFFLSSLLLLVCWAIMCLAGFYVLEVNLGLKEGSNFISMAKTTLGSWGQLVAWLTYLLLLYSLLAAYLSAGGGLFIHSLKTLFVSTPTKWFGPIPWIVMAGLIIYAGVKWVDYFNRFLIIGLVIAYVLLVTLTTPNIHSSYITGGHPEYLFAALPIIITAFGYHVIIPSLRVYLRSDAKKLKKVVLFGSLIPLIVYLIWDLVVFGTIPVAGKSGLAAIYHSGQPATGLTQSLSVLLHNPWVVTGTRFFIFFAIASSFLGIATSLFDFLSDGFGIRKTPMGRLLILIIMFAPPLVYAEFYPRGFILALSYAGVFVAILHGILPGLMVWAGRKKGIATPYRAPGGLFGVWVLLIFSTLVILAQVLLNLKWITSV